MTEVRTTHRHAGAPSWALRPFPGRHAASKPAPPFPRRAILLALAVLAIAAAAGTLTMALLSGQPSGPPAHSQPASSHITAAVLTARTTACTTTNSYSYSVSLAGTVRQTWTRKYACGHDYQKWERITSRSKTGAHYTENVYRDERSYPHWWQDVRKWAVSKAGTRTYTHTVTSGG